jgi:hypothetical protein
VFEQLVGFEVHLLEAQLVDERNVREDHLRDHARAVQKRREELVQDLHLFVHRRTLRRAATQARAASRNRAGWGAWRWARTPRNERTAREGAAQEAADGASVASVTSDVGGADGAGPRAGRLRRTGKTGAR